MDKILFDASDPEVFRRNLQSRAKAESIEDRARHIAVLNTSRYVYGLTMSEIRGLASEILKLDPIGFLDSLCGESYEEVMIEGLVIVGLKPRDEIYERLKSWIEKIDCWSLCDSVITTMKFLKSGPLREKYFEFFMDISMSEKEMVSRFGIVGLMQQFIDDEHIDRVLSRCAEIKNEYYYSKMAVAWLLSFAYVKFSSKVEALFESGRLDPFTQNKAISKCRDSYRLSDEQKEKLKQYKIKKS